MLIVGDRLIQVRLYPINIHVQHKTCLNKKIIRINETKYFIGYKGDTLLGFYHLEMFLHLIYWFKKRRRLFTPHIKTSYPPEGKKSRSDRRYNWMNCDQSLISLD